MKKYKIGVIGSFCFGRQTYGGQSLKTKNLTVALEEVIGKEDIHCVDTRGWKKHPFSLIKNIFRAVKNCESIIILPADRGVKLIPRLTLWCNKRAKANIYYSVIGGWLPQMLESDKRLLKTLKHIDGIWVETHAMKAAMDNQGFSNVTVVPNFKDIMPLKEDELVYQSQEPYTLCTFSRVLKEKGIEDAIDAVKLANDRLGRAAYALNIYGQVDEGYIEAFEAIKASFPEFITYQGTVPGDQSINTVKNCYMLLFPTYFYGEGFPGTLIDAFSAGVPVLASDWAYNTEIVENNVTGVICNANDVEDLCDKLVYCYNNKETINRMKSACLISADKYSKKNVINQIMGLMNM